jgi:hypothetical protein
LQLSSCTKESATGAACEQALHRFSNKVSKGRASVPYAQAGTRARRLGAVSVASGSRRPPPSRHLHAVAAVHLPCRISQVSHSSHSRAGLGDGEAVGGLLLDTVTSLRRCHKGGFSPRVTAAAPQPPGASRTGHGEESFGGKKYRTTIFFRNNWIYIIKRSKL